MFWGIIGSSIQQQEYWVLAYCVEHEIFDIVMCSYGDTNLSLLSAENVRTSLCRSLPFKLLSHKSLSDITWCKRYIDAVLPTVRERLMCIFEKNKNLTFGNYVKEVCKFDCDVWDIGFFEKQSPTFKKYWKELSSAILNSKRLESN